MKTPVFQASGFKAVKYPVVFEKQLSVLTLVEDSVIELNWNVVPGVLQASSWRRWRVDALDPNARFKLKLRLQLWFSCHFTKYIKYTMYLLIW